MEGRAGDDSLLVDRLRQGDPRAFEDLVIAYQHRVFGVALRMLGSRAEAEDLAQEVFVRVHDAIAEFRGDAKLSTWLYTIASRLCLNHLASSERRMIREGEETLTRLASSHASPAAELERNELEAALHRAIAELPEERRMIREGEETLTRLASSHASPAAELERSELEAALHRAIAELPEERRIVVVLRDLEGLSYEDIAAVLELELGTVRSRLHRARMDLKEKLERFLP